MRITTYGGNLTANTETTVFTVPTGYYATLTLMHIFNSSASSKHITVVWHDQTTAADINILYQYTVATKNPYQFVLESSGVVLEEGDTLKMTSETGSTMSYICTFEVEKKTGI